MTKSPEVPPETGAEELSFPHHTRYGLYLVPSDELAELITGFYTPAALRKLGSRPLRLGVAQKTIDIANFGAKKSAEVEAAISTYSRQIKKYELGMQFRLRRDGFVYTQERSHRGAATRLLFRIAASETIRQEVMRPPFFEPGTDAPLQASLVLPTSEVVPDADHQAQEIEQRLMAKHPSAIREMAHFAYYLTGLQVASREIPSFGHLRVVQADEGQENTLA